MGNLNIVRNGISKMNLLKLCLSINIYMIFCPGKFGCDINGLTISQTCPCFYVSAVQVFWKHCRKRRYCSLWAISSFPTVFSNHLLLNWKSLKLTYQVKDYFLTSQSWYLKTRKKKPFENILAKENGGNQQFLYFPPFLTFRQQNSLGTR